jgi:hypothetical protein
MLDANVEMAAVWKGTEGDHGTAHADRKQATAALPAQRATGASERSSFAARCFAQCGSWSAGPPWLAGCFSVGWRRLGHVGAPQATDRP